jgi:hypothetical protein
MTVTSRGVRNGRSAAGTRRRPPQTPPRPGGRGGASYGAYTDGATALQIGYADPVEDVRTTAPVRPTRSAPPRRIPTTAPAAPPAPVAVPRASFVVLLLVIVVAGVLGVLVLNTKINENAFKIADLEAQRAALELQEQQLAQELADRESPGNLAAAARRLGLVPAGVPAFIELPEGTVFGDPQPARGDRHRADAGGNRDRTDAGGDGDAPARPGR